LSGQCGRLKCCLNYELDTYLDALQHFPEYADTLQVKKGTAILIKKDIFKNLMWYVLPDTNKQYPLTIERVKKIKALNKDNVIPEELEAVEITSSKPREVEPEFVDVVGQITLKSLEKADKKKRFSKGNQQKPEQRNQQQRPGGGNPNQPGQQKGSDQRNPQQPKINRPPNPNQSKQRPPQSSQKRRPPRQMPPDQKP